MDRLAHLTDLPPGRLSGPRLRRHVARFFSVVILLVASRAGAVETTEVQFADGTDISANLYFIEDPDRDLAIRDVAGPTTGWRPNVAGYVNLGYTRSAYWFRVDIDNPRGSERTALLEMDFPSLDFVDLYVPDGRGGFSETRTGDRRVFESRPIGDPNFLFPLSLKSGISTVYMRVLNAGSLRFTARLYTERGFVEKKNRLLPRLWLLYGMLFLVVGFYLFVYLLLRKSVYLHFALFASTLFLYQISHRGYAFQFLWPGQPWWANVSLPLLMNLLGMFGAFFVRAIMETRTAAPRTDRIFLLFGYVLFPMAAGLAIVLPARLCLQMTYALLMAFATLVIIHTGNAFRRGNRFARYFLSGMGGVALFTVVGTLTAFGRLPLNFFTEWSTELGFLWLVFSASAGMIDRMKVLADDLRSSRAEQEKNIELLTRANQELAATNEELNAAMEELSATNEEFEAQNEELIAAENDLKRSEEKYRNLVENINEVIYSIDASGALTYLSPAFEKMTGFTPAEIGSRNFASLIHPDDVAGIVARFGELALGEIRPSVYRIMTKGGEYRWITSISRPIFHRGSFIGANGVLTDIHERKEAEDRVIREKTFATTIIDTLPGIFFILAGDGTLVRWKGRVKGDDAFGYTPEEVRAMDALDMVDPDDRGLAAAKIAEAFSTGQASTEIAFVRKNGDRLVFHLVVSRMTLDGEVFLIGIGFEVTDRKLAEEERERTRAQLIQAQKMEAIGTLAGGIAHDFNNMLMGIMGSLDLIRLILTRDGQIDRGAILNYIEIALESSRRSAEMTRRLLTLSRKSGLQTVPMDVNETIGSVFRLCRDTLPKSVRLDFREDSSPLRVMADPVQIQQVLLNLCVNASHAMTIMRPAGRREGGILSVTASGVSPSEEFCSLYPLARPGAMYIRLEVADTGVGIEDDVREQIFDPFFTTKRKEEGTGLGLAMAYTIVQQHGGFIDVVSRVGEGSVFSVYLPALEGQSSADSPAKVVDELETGEGRLLLVDDEKPVLGIAAGMLERLGYEVVSAESGSEALEIFGREHHGLDAVILDLSMPGMSGLEVFERMKEDDPGVRVLLASGFIEESVLNGALSRGVADFIQKPYTIVQLSAKIKHIMRPPEGGTRPA